MSGLEIPAFIIGLGGLISVFEKGFEVWRVIRRADDFGDDVADWMCKLEMEFFRFQTWWTALEHLAITKQSSHSVLNVPLQSSPLQVTLDKQFGKPIIDALDSLSSGAQDLLVLFQLCLAVLDPLKKSIHFTICYREVRSRRRRRVANQLRECSMRFPVSTSASSLRQNL